MNAVRANLLRPTVILIIAAWSTLARPQELKPDELYSKSVPSVVTLTVERVDGAVVTGTGFLAIRDGLAVTAWHVVDGAKDVRARFSDGTTLEVAGLVGSNERLDLAILEVPKTGRPLLALSKEDPPIGSKVFAIGAPRGLEFSLTDGLVSQVRSVGDHKEYQVSCPVSPGNSGGPIFNASGSVIGIVSWGVVDAQNISFCIPSVYLGDIDSKNATTPWASVQSKAVTSPKSNIAWKPVVGVKTKYKLDVQATFDLGGQRAKMVFGMTQIFDIKKVESDKITVEAASSDMTLTINGEDMSSELGDMRYTSVVVSNRFGVTLDVSSTAPGDEDQARLENAYAFIYPDKEIRIGESWSHLIKGEKSRGTVDAASLFKLEGTETIGKWKTYRISYSFREVASGAASMSGVGTIWIDMQDGNLVQGEYLLRNVVFNRSMPPTDATAKIKRIGD